MSERSVRRMTRAGEVELRGIRRKWEESRYFMRSVGV